MSPFSRKFHLSLYLILGVFAALTMAAAADNYLNSAKTAPLELYKVTIGSSAEAVLLRSLPVDPVLRVDGGYLVLAGTVQAESLAESGLHHELIRSGVSRNTLAVDISFDRRNAALYPVVYQDKGVVLLAVPSGELHDPDGLNGLAPIGDREIRIVFKTPPLLDWSQKLDEIELEDLIALVVEDSLSNYVYDLQAFPPRVTGSASDYASRDYIYERFEEFGYDSIRFDSFTYGGNNVQNIIAYKVGTTYPDHHIVIGGHKDAVSGSPGADDNGSGTAGVLEMARVLKDIETKMTFVFICFDGEEQGLHGSWHYADAAAARGDSIVMMLNMDMIGYEGNTDNVKVYHGSDLTWPNLWRSLGSSLSTDMNGVLSGTITASDHYPFQQNGYDVVFLIEYNFSSVYHTFRDSTSYMDFTYMTRIVRTSLATAYEVNNIYIPVPGLSFTYPGGLPEYLSPGEETSFTVEIIGSSGGTVVPGSGILYYRPEGSAADSAAMTDLGGGLYEATIPSFACEDGIIEYWLGADEVTTGRHYDGSSASPYKAAMATDVTTAFEDGFETNLGWTFSGGQWGRGTPTGGGGNYGGPDPSSAYSGSNVLGYNLSGDYANGIPQYHATSPMIDCTNLQNVKLSFYRWLGVEQPMYDSAYVRVSTNGTSWINLWQNNETIYDGAWIKEEFDISNYADGNQIYIRFTMGGTDGAWTYCGWNIDELTVIGYECDQTQLIVTTEDVPDCTMGAAYSYQLEYSGGAGGCVWSDRDGDLTGTGLSLSSSGLLFGMPSTSGDITFTAVATDKLNNSGEKEFTFTINPELAITTSTIDDGEEGTAYSYSLACTGGTVPLTWADKNGDLDGTGLTLSAAGLIEGIPTVSGQIEFIAEVADAIGAVDEASLAFNISPAYICGDLDDDGIVNILDIILLINYKFKDGAAPDPMESANVDGIGAVDILDVVYLVNYKFKGGPAPACQ